MAAPQAPLSSIMTSPGRTRAAWRTPTRCRRRPSARALSAAPSEPPAGGPWRVFVGFRGSQKGRAASQEASMARERCHGELDQDLLVHVRCRGALGHVARAAHPEVVPCEGLGACRGERTGSQTGESSTFSTRSSSLRPGTCLGSEAARHRSAWQPRRLFRASVWEVFGSRSASGEL